MTGHFSSFVDGDMPSPIACPRGFDGYDKEKAQNVKIFIHGNPNLLG
jgi:hypothetical protein